jgi:hypothetical protein
MDESGSKPEVLITTIPEHLDERYNNLYLDASKELASELKELQQSLFEDLDTFTKLVTYISESARKGIPVDLMVEKLIQELTFESTIIDAIQKQLDYSG